MFKFMQVTVGTVLLFFLLWSFGRDFLPGTIRYSFAGNAVDRVVEQFMIEAAIYLNLFEENRFDKNVIPVSSDDALSLIRSLQNQPNPVVLYFYSTDCLACHNNLNTLYRINRDYNAHAEDGKPNVFVLAVALADDKTTLSRFLHHEMLNMNFNSLLIDANREMTLKRALERANLLPDQRSRKLAPYLQVTKQGKNVRRINSGFGAEKDLRALLDNYLAREYEPKTIE